VTSLREKAIKGAVWSAVQNWGQNLVNLIVFLVLARLLGAEAFGLVAYATVFTAFLTVFHRQGFGQALVQRADLQPGHLDTAFWTSIVISFPLTLVLLGLAGIIAGVLDEPELGPVLQWLSLTLIIEGLANTPQALLRRKLAFKSLAVRSLVATLTGGVVGIAMAVEGCGVWSLVGLRLTTSVVGLVALWIACRWRPGFSASVQRFRELSSFGVFAMGRELLGFFDRRTADLLIGTFLGKEALGFYTIGFQILLVMTQMFTQTISSVALPTFSRLQHDLSQMRTAFMTATRMTSLAAFPAFLGAAVLAPEIVYGIMGDKWGPSIPIMRTLAFLGIVQSVVYCAGPVVTACGKPAWIFALALLNTLANVVLFAVTVRWGIVAVAAGFTLRAYLSLPLALWAVRAVCGLRLREYVWQFAPCVACTVIMLAFVTATKLLSVPHTGLPVALAVCILAGVGVYAATLRLLSPRSFREAVDVARVAAGSG
jgi:PST family polysaccharide transporter